MLCVPDHRNDPATLERWLANKVPASFEMWVSNPENYCVVEEVQGQVQGVGLVNKSGELLLFYVAPGHQRQGLGRNMHEALVSQARRWGVTQIQLESTSVARQFYESLGYRSAGPPRLLFGVLRAYPYVKEIPA